MSGGDNLHQEIKELAVRLAASAGEGLLRRGSDVWAVDGKGGERLVGQGQSPVIAWARAAAAYLQNLT